MLFLNFERKMAEDLILGFGTKSFLRETRIDERILKGVSLEIGAVRSRLMESIDFLKRN